MADLPTGTVTFLFTDIEGSTTRWEQHPEVMSVALARHDEILESSIVDNGGVVFSKMGDGMAAAFSSAIDAAAAAAAAQQRLAKETWPESLGGIAARMGLHTGEGTVVDGQYLNQPLNRCARLMAIGHGGQVLLSGATEALVRGGLRGGVHLLDLGEHRLRDLSEPMRVYQIEQAGLQGKFPALRSLNAFPGNLPLQVSSFVGRERELSRIQGVLTEGRIVTLTGVGGVGKTRLALQVAAEVLPRFREGAWLVELAPVRDPEGVPGAVGAVFGISPQLGQRLEEALVESLRAKQLLLILDNCEHLLDPVGDLVEVLGRTCPSLVVLATSREGLAVEGERMMAVPSLHAPSPDADLSTLLQSDAGSLFVDRANAVDAEFALTEQNARAVAQVCRRLDGVPLAIELAAARVGTMTPAELAIGLDRRFDTLAGRRRRAVERHQTLRAAIDWSYDLCAEPERRLLARLAVFVGGCTRAAAEAVCAGEPIRRQEVFDLLAGLVAKSLVVAEPSGVQTRYRLLETIREYAEGRLADAGEAESVAAAHAGYFRDESAAQQEKFNGPGQLDALRFLDSDLENLRAAIDHAVETEDVDLALRLARSTALPGSSVAHRPEFPRQLDAILQLPEATEHTLYPFGLARRAMLAAQRGEVARAEAGFEEALTASRGHGSDPDNELLVESMVLMSRRFLAVSDESWREAADQSRRIIALARSAGGVAPLQSALVSAAIAYAMAGEPHVALSLAAEGLDLAQQMGAPWSIAFNQMVLGMALADQDPERARSLLHEGSQRLDEIGILNPIDADAITRAAAWIQDWPLVLEWAPRAIRLSQRVGMRPALARNLNFVARAVASTDPQTSALLLGAARRFHAEWVSSTGARTSEDVATGFHPELRIDPSSLLGEVIDEQTMRGLLAQGEAIDEDEAVAIALAAIQQAAHPY
jgi:predicted ATPase/class 3 adenylate cyclase